MFRRLNAYLLCAGLLFVSFSDVVAAARKHPPTIRVRAARAGISIPDPRATVVGQSALEGVVFTAPRRMLSPQERAAVTKMATRKQRQDAVHDRRAKGYNARRAPHRLTPQERPTVEFLLTYDAKAIIDELRSSHSVRVFASKAAAVHSFIEKITTGRSGKLVEQLHAVRDQFAQILRGSETIPGCGLDCELEVHEDDDSGYDDGGDCGGYIEPVAKPGLLEFIHANRKAGYKLLVVSVLVGGVWGFAPLYLPLVASGAAVGGLFSGAAALVAGKPVAPAALDGVMAGSVASVMPTGGVLHAGLAGGVVSGVSALTDGDAAQDVARRAATGAVVGTFVHTAVGFLSPHQSPYVQDMPGSSARNETVVAPPMCQPRRLPFEDRSKALVLVEPQPVAPVVSIEPVVTNPAPEVEMPPMHFGNASYAETAQEAVQPVLHGAQPCKPWIERVYDLTGLSELFDKKTDVPACTPWIQRLYDKIGLSSIIASR